MKRTVRQASYSFGYVIIGVANLIHVLCILTTENTRIKLEV